MIYCEDYDGFNWIFILNKKIDRKINPYSHFCCMTSKGKININLCCRHPERTLRHATTKEAQRLWDALAKEGKRWNPETMQVEPIKKERWRADIGDTYWSLDVSDFTVFFSIEENHSVDNNRYFSGRYFETKDQAQRAAEKLKQELDEFWKEELK